MNSVFVSIVVPVRNGEDTISACLKSILRMDFPAERREILVVDNGSTDSTASMLKDFPVTHLFESTKGAAAARNRGIEESRGDILAFTDADCLVSKHWLHELVSGFVQEEVAGVDGRIVSRPGSTASQRYAALHRDFSLSHHRTGMFGPYACTANVAFTRAVFDQIGMFDTRFPTAAAEDIDFGWRFFDAELNLQHSPRAVVFHHNPASVRAFFNQQRRYGRGLAHLQAKYPQRLPWGWRSEALAWLELPPLLWQTLLGWRRHARRRGAGPSLNEAYFRLLKKLALRVGFLGEKLKGKTA